ncbi:dihydroorotate dehydrogenase-like protein [Planctellipticum variicoloris]|uniref:dihydroorotate dehydrogenase-like protein n=1 Tax=Planctellipticum variicoloris TaxID=3064265 RepID=UPI003013B20D|nr:dihydroorotate dehydrogenase-like protein [Planctomycetaceae bacterium SH412]
MVDLATDWVGLRLSSPLLVGASPLTDDLDALHACVEGGAGAVVMRSLFEEQIVAEQLGAHRWIDSHVDMNAEARTFLPESDVFGLGSGPYVARLRKLRDALNVPVIASLNGTTVGGWIDLACDLEQAGAAAVELNLYEVITDLSETAAVVEARQLAVVQSVVDKVQIPVIVKLSPFYSSLPGFARQLEQTGARAIVLFNRFYQPDIDLEVLDVSREVRLSTSAELPLRLHACALLSGRTSLQLAVSGGVHTGDDAAKAILAGAHVAQVVSVLLERGPRVLANLRDELRHRLSRFGYKTLAEARGVLSLNRAPDPHAWERLNYARLLESWQPRP